MAKIMIKCPTTGKAVPTGMSMDAASFAGSTFSDNSVGCRECGQTHTWSKGDAFLDE